jgi:hypothetical protein
VSSKDGTFFEERGHNSREYFSMNFWSKYIFRCGRPYCMDPYSPYSCTYLGTEIEVIFGMIF